MEVKYYRVTGRMLLSHDKFPVWWKFSKEVRAIKREHAIEKVLSELGSNHRVKRYHIVIEKVEEIPPEMVKDRNLLAMGQLKKWVKI